MKEARQKAVFPTCKDHYETIPAMYWCCSYKRYKISLWPLTHCDEGDTSERRKGQWDIEICINCTGLWARLFHFSTIWTGQQGYSHHSKTCHSVRTEWREASEECLIDSNIWSPNHKAVIITSKEKSHAGNVWKHSYSVQTTDKMLKPSLLKCLHYIYYIYIQYIYVIIIL